jgi:hypothetical protein
MRFRNKKLKSGAWGQVRNLEDQLCRFMGGYRLRFQGAGQIDGKDVFIVGYEVWNEQKVINEFIPYLRNKLAKFLRELRVWRWAQEFHGIKRKYVCCTNCISVHDPLWKFQMGPRYEKLRLLLLKSRNRMPERIYERL